MKRFKFKLDKVLNYRETLENLAKNAYRDAVHALNMEKDKLAELLDQMEKLKNAYTLEAGAEVEPHILSMLSLYMSQLFNLIEKQREIIKEKEKIVQEKFELWNTKRKDVKVIKRLEEKKWKAYLKEADKEEQAFQDEIFIAKTVRGMER